FSSRRRHTRFSRDWSSDVCSSDLNLVSFTKELLAFPLNYQVEEIPSGCCGMAGSFGYEKEHYEVSQKVAELVLFPTLRKTSEERSEERRVGKEYRTRRSKYHQKKT